MSSAYSFIFMQIKLIFIWKVLQEDSFETEAQDNSEMAYSITHGILFDLTCINQNFPLPIPHCSLSATRVNIVQ